MGRDAPDGRGSANKVGAAVEGPVSAKDKCIGCASDRGARPTAWPWPGQGLARARQWLGHGKIKNHQYSILEIAKC